MIALAVLVLLLLVAAALGVAVRTVRHGRASVDGPTPPEGTAQIVTARAPARAGRPALDDLLAEWAQAGLLSTEQIAPIIAHERARFAPPVGTPPARRRLSPLAEVLGYLGGVLVLGGLVVLVAQYWPDLSTGARLGLSGSAAALLTVAGALIARAKDRSVTARLRGFLWLAASGATAVFAYILTRDALDVTNDAGTAVAVSAAVCLHSGLLWWLRDRPVQQLTCLAAATCLAGAVTARVAGDSGWAGVAVVGAGAMLLAAALRRRLAEPTPTEALGALAVLSGGLLVTGQWQGPGLLLTVVLACCLLALALVRRFGLERDDRLAVGVLGAVGLGQAAPATVSYFAAHAGGATGLVTLAVGAGLLAAGIAGWLHLPRAVEALGGVVALAGAAVIFGQWHGAAPILGAAVAVGMLALGAGREHMALSVIGSLGLLVNVPWAIVWFFPGEGRTPVLVVVTGLLVLAVATILARTDRHRHARLGRPAVRARRRPRHP